MAELIRDLAMVIRPSIGHLDTVWRVNGVCDRYYLARISYTHWPVCEGTKLSGAMA
jgi:hypothetical protein